MINDKCNLMIVAGEASGDAHAAKLVRALRESAPSVEFEFFGATGEKLRRAGVETIVCSDDFSVVGLPEIARALPMFWKAFRLLKNEAARRRPDAVIFVDFPDFNLKLAKSLKKRGLKTIYYISPQLWAWREYRAKTIAEYVDLLLTILPFEKDWYRQKGIAHVEYVGNPTVWEVHSKTSKREFCRKYKLDENKPIIALLPGSRHKETVRILPVLLETAAEMTKKKAEIQFAVALAGNRKLEEAETCLTAAKNAKLILPETLIVVQNETYDLLNAADAAAVTSGTATLETAIVGTPLAIVYKSSTFNYELLRPLITVEHFGLINLIAGERLAAELIQDEFTPESLAEELFRLIKPETNRRMRERLRLATEKLGAGGASKQAAAHILRLLEIENKDMKVTQVEQGINRDKGNERDI